MRFELTVGNTPTSTPSATPRPSGFEAADGRYTVHFDPFEPHAGQENQLSFHVSRSGQPALDMIPFLRVDAHAVFIDSADLTYVHVHAAPAAAPKIGSTGASVPHDLTGKTPANPGALGHADALAGSHLPSDLTLHVLGPKAGTYLLWLQFMASGQVRTMPFIMAVT
jgi:hypothetical protein